ncbi:MAG: hypothetical protein ABH886_09200 [Candidatus Desantisbacteria bacterium]
MQDAYATEFCELRTAECSFFNLIDSIWEGEQWNNAPLHRIFSLMRKMNARSYLQEPLALNTELKEEKEMAEQRCKGAVDLKAIRLSFFCSFPEDDGWKNEKRLPNEHLLGYAVVVSLILPDNSHRSYVLESVLRPPSVVIYNEQDKQPPFIQPITNYYVHNVRKFETVIGTSDNPRKIPITGSFFSQQNDLTHVCAHAALRMAINSSPSPMFQNNSKLTNKQINDILKIDFSSPDKSMGHYGEVQPEDRTGLSVDEIEIVVKTLGGRVISADFQRDSSIEYDHFIYPLMESGYPVILCVEGRNAQKGEQFAHAVSVFGHTMNSDRWGPEAHQGYRDLPVMEYLSAVEWADHLIIGDDNYGGYVTLPTDMIRNFIVPTKNPNLHASYAIGIVPKDVILSGYKAEQVATGIAHDIICSSALDPAGEWLTRMRESGNNLVCRTLLVSKSTYQEKLDALLGDNLATLPIDIRNEIDSLPDFFWVSEFSLPHIYTTNKHKLGDVLISADALNDPSNALDAFLFAWFPGYFISSSDLQPKKWHLIDHVQLLRSSGETGLLEW